MTDFVFAQVNDAGLWLSFNFTKKINPAWSVTLSEELRMDENITEAGTVFSDAGINYKINNRFRVSANYRYINKRRPDVSYDKRHRYYFDFSYRDKFSRIATILRVRYESQYKDVFSSSKGFVPENHLRGKLTFKFDLDKKYTPYLYSEIFMPLNNPKVKSIDNGRYCAGIEYKFSRVHTLDAFYMIQQEYHVKNPKRDYIIGLGYNLTL